MKVSIVTLTIPGREALLERCINLVKRQTYGQIEHIIVTGDSTIGAKRNTGCTIADGDIIMMLDDDDIIVPDFVEVSVNHMRQTRCDVTGLCNAYFYGSIQHSCWEYEYTGRQYYVIGSTMMFKRSVLDRSKFPDINEGEEIGFLTNAGRVLPHNYKTGFLAYIHGSNTASQKQIRHMKSVDVGIAKGIIEKALFI